jgi:hypothetical protein
VISEGITAEIIVAVLALTVEDVIGVGCGILGIELQADKQKTNVQKAIIPNILVLVVCLFIFYSSPRRAKMNLVPDPKCFVSYECSG